MRTPLFILTFAAVLLSACGHNDYDLMWRMDRAEAMLWSRPDSSLALLDTPTARKLVSPAIRARHALLTVQSRSRCHLPATSDSLIRTALNYYKRQPIRHPELLLRAWLYYADVLLDLDRPKAALDALLKAQELVRKDTPLLYRFLLESNLGYINRRSDLYGRALTHHRKAFRLAETHNDTLWMMTALANLMALPGYDTLDIARQYPVSRFDGFLGGLPATLQSKLWQNAGVWYGEHGDTVQATRCYRNALRADSTRTSTLLTLGTLHEKTGQDLSADSLYARILEHGTPAQKSRVHRLLSDRYATRADYSQAAHHYAAYMKYARQVLDERDTRRILELQTEQERLKAAYRELRRTTTLTLVITVLAGTLLLVAYKSRNLVRRHRRKLEKQVAETSRLEQEKDVLCGRVSQQQKNLNRYKVIYRIESDHNHIHPSDLAALNLILMIRRENYVLQKDKDYAVLYRWSNLAYNGYYDRMHTAYEALTATDLALCCLLRSGCDIAHCATVLGSSEAAVRKRIQRMYPLLGVRTRGEFLAVVLDLPAQVR